jgi:Fic family protein
MKKDNITKEQRMEKTRKEHTYHYNGRSLDYLTEKFVKGVIELYPKYSVAQISEKLGATKNQTNQLIHKLLVLGVMEKKPRNFGYKQKLEEILSKIKK